MADERHFTPADTPEFAEWERWHALTEERRLRTVPCLSAWTDICGFGAALENCGWNLHNLQAAGVFEALGRAYSIMAHPFIIGVPPAPSERVLVLNDGIARTVDVNRLADVDPALVVLFVRALFINHYRLADTLARSGLGLRTVIAGGTRCQYAPTKFTGSSLLSYTNEPSEFGRRILEQQFVYNPAEFQMNTAFALAYTLDAMGSHAGLRPHRLYIEEGWISTLQSRRPDAISRRADGFDMLWRQKPGLSVYWSHGFNLNAKGKATTVYRVDEVVVRECFEGEETVFPMGRFDPEASA